MSIAAVPKYLGKDFKDASPGMRFGLLLPIWTTRDDQEQEVNKRANARSREGQELAEFLQVKGMEATIAELQNHPRNPLPGLWDKNDFAAHNAWQNIRALSPDDKKRMEALVSRQSALIAGNQNSLSLHAKSTAPFTTGLGNEHPTENGFAFLNPYGLPYLPGSGVKGVLRQAARELASGTWGDTRGWSQEQTCSIKVDKKVIHFSMLDALFGKESQDGDKEHIRGALTFWDVIPQIKGNHLDVEVMTPHQGHYYQQKKDRKTGDSTSPHESGQPIPIYFLTVPPGSGFAFHVQCNLSHLQELAPELAKDDHWKTLLTAAFEQAFDWLGFGAKTAVGYGAMQRDRDAEHAAEEARKKKQATDQRKQMSAEQGQIQDLRTLYEKTKAASKLDAGCQVASERMTLLEAASNWESAEYRQEAAKLLRLIAKDLPWSKKAKDKAKELMAKLETN